jgi:hypothetical protein
MSPNDFLLALPLFLRYPLLAMPAPLNVNREAVKTLAIAIGVRQAARKMGLDEKTVLGWSHRHNWFKGEHEPPSVNGCKSVKSPEVMAASEVMAEILADDERETRLSLAKYARKCSKSAASSPDLDKARLVHKVAQTAGIVHRWADQSASVQFSLNVLNVGELDVSMGE